MSISVMIKQGLRQDSEAAKSYRHNDHGLKLGKFTIMSQPIKVDFFICANQFLVVVSVRLPVLRLSSIFIFFEIVFHFIF